MTKLKMNSQRKKKIKTLLSMMNKQNQRFIPITQKIVEMMDMVTTDEEIDFLLKRGTGRFDYKRASESSNMTSSEFDIFFDTIKRKGLIHIEQDDTGKEVYRLNAIAVGWYEAMMHYLVGKPQEKLFSEKFNEYFKLFSKFNFFPLRNIENLLLRPLTKPSQDSALMDPAIEGKIKKKKISVNTTVSIDGSRVYPTFYVNSLIEDYGNQDAIYAFPCVCRHGNRLIESNCSFDMPRDSCIAFGTTGKAWSEYGYGRHISKGEALEILKEVRDKGAVHSVIHERDDYRLPVMAICNCCWDCCAILKPYNMGAMPLKYRASYTAKIKDDADCKGCGSCEKYCPTTAMRLMNRKSKINQDICIGCGQCAFQCVHKNIELFPSDRMVYLPILKKSEIRVVN